MAALARDGDPTKAAGGVLTAKQAPAGPARDGGQKGISLEDIQATKGLVERVGAKQLRALIDVLAR